MKAHIVRNERSGQIYIEVTYPTGYKNDLWEHIVEYCAKDLSNNEVKEVYRECSKQLNKMNADDVPPTFLELMRELEQAIIKRHCYIEPLNESEKTVKE